MAHPFHRQAGGKAEQVPLLLKHVPGAFSVYAEPFLGGGAVFYALQERGVLEGKVVLLGDADSALIRLNQTVQRNPTRLAAGVAHLAADMDGMPAASAREYFTAIRDLWNAGAHRSDYFLFLLAASFNGLRRRNRQGQLNMSWNKEIPPRIPSLETLQACALALVGVELLPFDFRRWENGHGHLHLNPDAEEEHARALAAHASGDGSIFLGPEAFVYLDPPYLGDFTGYTQDAWSRDDLRDLIQLASLWTQRGAHVVCTHADTPDFRDLVREFWPEAELAASERRSINRDGDGRAPVPTLVAVSRDGNDTPRTAAACSG